MRGLLTISLVVLSTALFGQTPSYRFPDSNRLGDCQISYEGQTFMMGDTAVLVIKSYEDMFNYLEEDCGEMRDRYIDFSTKVLLIKNSSGDCHAWFEDEIIVDRVRGFVKWKEYNHWGGCRAGGYWKRWITVPKPDFEAKFIAEEIIVDR